MKRALINSVCDLMEENKKIYMFTADLGYGVMNKIIDKFPEHFVNVGICEQNLISMAAGMALEGNIVFAYSIGNFPTLRCLEQIRNDVAYHRANVKIVAVGGGFAYGNLGMSHHATEDIAVMRAIPGMVVLAPADTLETIEAVRFAVAYDGPVYIRLGRGGESEVIHRRHNIRKICCVKRKTYFGFSKRLAVLGMGTVMQDVKAAVEELENSVDISAYAVTMIKPIDVEGIVEICKENDYIITVEEHNIIGGLGSVVAEVIAENCIHTKLLRMGMKDEFTQVVGSPEYLRRYYELDKEGIIRNVEMLLGEEL